jgi:hypothetical protein
VATLAFYAGRHLLLFVTDFGKYAYLPPVMAAAFLYTWIFNNTGESVLLAMLLHASQGAMVGFLIPMFSGACNVRQFRLLDCMWR